MNKNPFPLSIAALLAMVLASFTGTLSFSASCLAESDELANAVVCQWTYMDGKTGQTTASVRQEGDFFQLRIPAEQVGANVKFVDIGSPMANAQAGDEGFYVFSQGQLITFRDQADALFSPYTVYMPMFGVKTPQAGCFLAIVKGMPYDYKPRVQLKDKTYSLNLRFSFEGTRPYEDIVVDLYPLSGPDATYSGVARRYRKYQLDRGEVRPLSERIKGNSALEYAVNSVEVRVRQGWKPVPSPVEEQTPETEPPMKVVIDFDRCGQIIDEFKRQGVDKAEFCLVGWNIGGHDGRYPQIFPVDQRLGGESKLRALIQKAQAEGYQIVCHTNSTDGYAIADTWNADLCLVNRDGSINHPKTTWGGGRMYNLCPKQVYERYTTKDLPEVAKLGFRGVHYIDVISTVAARECCDPNHPLTKTQCVEYWKKILAEGQKNFGAVGSEGAFDHVIANLDYCLYATFNKICDETTMKLVERTVPIYQLVYNGIVLQNPATETVNYTLKSPNAQLKMVEFNGRPIFYYYSRFKTDGKNWMGDVDLACGTEEELKESVKAVKKGFDQYESLRRLQLLFMEDHQKIADNVFKTTFSDGTELICNYRDEAFEYNGQSVPAKGWIEAKK